MDTQYANTPENQNQLSAEIAELGFPFRTRPYRHQYDAFVESRDREEFALFMEMGTGKTKVVIDTAAYLFDQGQIGLFLIFGNKGSYRNWFTKEIPRHLPDHVPFYMTYWDAGAKDELLKSYDEIFEPMPVLKIVIVNIEALSSKRGAKFCYELVQRYRTLMTIDESTTIKNVEAQRTKTALFLGKHVEYRRIMTGMPVTKNPMDLWGQCEFLKPGILGNSSYYGFRATYADLEQETMYVRGGKQNTHKKIVGYKNLERLQRVLKRFSYRVRKDQCLDLPPKIYETIEVELTPEQRHVYDTLRKKQLVMLESGETISTPMMVTMIMRLHQIVCGSTITDDGTEIEIPDNRIPTLMAHLDETDDKVVIWATYVRDIKRITAAIAKQYGEESVVAYYGATSGDERNEAITRFSSDDSLRYFVANPAVGGWGTDLISSATVVYYSNSYNLEHRMQSEDRNHRIGQGRPVVYLDVVARGTVDERIMTCLRDKRDVSAEVMGDPKNFGSWLQ